MGKDAYFLAIEVTAILIQSPWYTLSHTCFNFKILGVKKELGSHLDLYIGGSFLITSHCHSKKYTQSYERFIG